MGYFSNGSEGMDYEARYCERCVHQKPDEGGCAVWLAHMLHNYRDCNDEDSVEGRLFSTHPLNSWAQAVSGELHGIADLFERVGRKELEDRAELARRELVAMGVEL